MWKQCTKCKKILPLYFFGKHGEGLFGLHPNCLECRRKQSKEYYEKNRDKEMERSRKKFILYYQKNKDKLNAKRRKWYADNRERELKKKKDWYVDNSDLARKRSREWKRKNPDKVREWIRKRQLLEFNSEGWHTEEDWDFIKKSSGYKCLCCGRTDVKLTRDHITPLSEGGHDYILNIQPLCQSCNSSKGVKFTDYRPPELYRAVLEYFS